MTRKEHNDTLREQTGEDWPEGYIFASEMHRQRHEQAEIHHKEDDVVVAIMGVVVCAAALLAFIATVP